jgi:hypothetical protein
LYYHFCSALRWWWALMSRTLAKDVGEGSAAKRPRGRPERMGHFNDNVSHLGWICFKSLTASVTTLGPSQGSSFRRWTLDAVGWWCWRMWTVGLPWTEVSYALPLLRRSRLSTSWTSRKVSAIATILPSPTTPWMRWSSSAPSTTTLAIIDEWWLMWIYLMIRCMSSKYVCFVNNRASGVN